MREVAGADMRGDEDIAPYSVLPYDGVGADIIRPSEIVCGGRGQGAVSASARGSTLGVPLPYR